MTTRNYGNVTIDHKAYWTSGLHDCRIRSGPPANWQVAKASRCHATASRCHDWCRSLDSCLVLRNVQIRTICIIGVLHALSSSSSASSSSSSKQLAMAPLNRCSAAPYKQYSTYIQCRLRIQCHIAMGTARRKPCTSLRPACKSPASVCCEAENSSWRRFTMRCNLSAV